MHWKVLAASLLLCVAFYAQAQSFQSHSGIKTLVTDYLQEIHRDKKKKTIRVGNLDPRLRLAKCRTRPETFFLPGSKIAGNTTVGVRCSAEKNWTVYVPASVKVYEKVLVSSKSLPRNKRIEAQDLESVEREVSGIYSGYYTRKKDLVGQVTRRTLPPGYLFSANTVQPPKLVKRGEDVSIIVDTPGFKVRMAGVALMDGGKQDKIKVKNKASKKVLDAVVTARGVVSIGI